MSRPATQRQHRARASVGASVGVAVALAVGLGALAFTPSARAESPEAGASDAGLDAQAAPPESVRGCVEALAKGASRPVMSEDLPRRGTSGWAATLTLTIRHGRGEHVLPNGLELQRASEAEKELRAAGFAFPEQDAGTGAARVTVLPEDPHRKEIVVTVLELPLVLLPEKPGRSTLVLPPLPVAVVRANGEVSTICTRAHSIVVDDPIADTPEPGPRPNPPPRAQREEWKEAKLAAGFISAGLALGLLGAGLYRKWKNRPRPAPPAPPPRPAWELALERLHEVRHAGLLDVGRQAEFCDRVSDALRDYLGATLGFDGLEQTTDEIAGLLAGGGLSEGERARVIAVLQECDLVKFAKFAPERAACAAMLDSVEQHVRLTMPRRGAEPRRPRGAVAASQPEPDVDAPPPPDAEAASSLAEAPAGDPSEDATADTVETPASSTDDASKTARAKVPPSDPEEPS